MKILRRLVTMLVGSPSLNALGKAPTWMWVLTGEERDLHHRPSASEGFLEGVARSRGLQPCDTSKGEWRCRCAADRDDIDPKFDTSVNPRFVKLCGRCGDRRPRWAEQVRP